MYTFICDLTSSCSEQASS